MIKRILSLCMALLAAAGASAQQDARIGRTEAVPYDMRHDAEARNLAASGHTLAFRPETTITAEPSTAPASTAASAVAPGPTISNSWHTASRPFRAGESHGIPDKHIA